LPQGRNLRIRESCALRRHALVLVVGKDPGEDFFVAFAGNEGAGIEANFAKVQDYLGATTHIRELDAPGYPWDKLATLLVGIDYAGWVCLEGNKPPQGDRVPALKAQKDLWTKLVTAARAAAK
jgi:hypothetical protein